MSDACRNVQKGGSPSAECQKYLDLKKRMIIISLVAGVILLFTPYTLPIIGGILIAVGVLIAIDVLRADKVDEFVSKGLKR